MRRPIGITVLAVFSLIVGVLYLLVGIGFLSSTNVSFRGGMIAGLSPRVGWLFLLIGIVDLAAAYGLWRLRRWGWGLMTMLIIINLGIAIGTLVAHIPVAGPIISLVVNGFILWYLLRPGVKAAFLAADTTREDLRRVA